MYIISDILKLLVKTVVTITLIFGGLFLFLAGFYGLDMHMALGEFSLCFAVMLLLGIAVTVLGFFLSVRFADDYA